MSDWHFLFRGPTWLLAACCLIASPAMGCIPIDFVPLPVSFATSSARIEGPGKTHAEEMLAKIREKNPAAITLIGRSDSRGSAEYNLRLSERRARAVADFLLKNGITAKIEVIAKGKSEPLQMGDVDELYPRNSSDRDVWTLNRSVQWKYEHEAASAGPCQAGDAPTLTPNDPALR